MKKFFANACIVFGWIIIITICMSSMFSYINTPELFVPNTLYIFMSVVFACAIGVFFILLGKHLNKKLSLETQNLESSKSTDYANSDVFKLSIAPKPNTEGVLISIGYFLLKLFLTLIPIGIGVFEAYICFKNEYYFDFSIYIMLFVVLTIYYAIIIWRQKTIQINDVMLLPLFHKIGLNKKCTEIQSRRYLVVFAIILGLTIVVPFSYYLRKYEFNLYHKDNLTNFLFSLPIILMFLYFIFAYAKQWIDEAKDMK